MANQESIITKAISQLKTSGYAHISSFLDAATVEVLKREMTSLVDAFDLEAFNRENNKQLSVFVAGAKQNSDQYFLESGDKVRYFLEKDVLDPGTSQLTVPKERALNKIGHALHWHCPAFKQVTFDRKVVRLAKAMGLADPVIVQSMIIFKHPQVGGEVVPHQDASYLHVLPQPEGAVFGFWIPLEDATTTNGCLEFIPGSHQSVPLATRWIRSTADPQDGSAISMSHTHPEAKYGADEEYVPVPAKSGDLLLIDGLVVHRSAPNRSPYPRPVYTFHVFDRGTINEPRTWDPNNWLQPSAELGFKSLYD